MSDEKFKKVDFYWKSIPRSTLQSQKMTPVSRLSRRSPLTHALTLTHMHAHTLTHMHTLAHTL